MAIVVLEGFVQPSRFQGDEYEDYRTYIDLIEYNPGLDLMDHFRDRMRIKPGYVFVATRAMNFQIVQPVTPYKPDHEEEEE